MPHTRLALAACLALLSAPAHAEEPPEEEALPECLAEAEAKADEAKSILLGNPSNAGRLLASALECEDRAEWRALRGFTLERTGNICEAVEEYRRALAMGGLAPRPTQRAQDYVNDYAAQCPP